MLIPDGFGVVLLAGMLLLTGNESSRFESIRVVSSLIILFNNCLTKGSCVCIWMDEFAGHFHADSLQRVPFSLASTLVGGARPVLADLNVYGIAICVDSGASESEVPGAKRNHPFFFFDCMVALPCALHRARERE